MNTAKLISLIFPLALIVGCSNPAKDVPAAAVEKASAPPTNEAPAAEVAGTYFAFGPTNSAVAFTASKVTRAHQGGFRKFAGEFKVVNGKVANTGNQLVIDTSSIYADDPRLTSHLKSPDFFDVAQFPTATFVSSKLEAKETNTTVTGELKLHGVSKSISFPVKVQVTEETVKVTGIFAINREDFGIKYPGMPNDLIRKEVVLRLNIKAVPGRADFDTTEQAAKTAAAAIPAPAPRGGGSGGPARR